MAKNYAALARSVIAALGGATFQAFHVQRTGHWLFGNVRGRRDIANGFQRSDHKDQHQRQQQTPFNAKTVIERRWHHNQLTGSKVKTGVRLP